MCDLVILMEQFPAMLSKSSPDYRVRLAGKCTNSFFFLHETSFLMK